MNKERLLRLADLLERDADNPNGVKFDLRAWAIPADRKYERISSDLTIIDSGDSTRWNETATVPVSCGTAACAMGLAAISGEFKDEGLTYTITSHGNLVPVYNGERGYDAASEFFDINVSHVAHLFSPEQYLPSERTGADGERLVAKRIRDLVAG